MKKFIICAFCAFCGLTASAQSQPKFGHVNTQEIIQAMPEFTTARTEIEKLTQQYEADLKSMQDELQKKAEAFEKEEATLPENIKTRRNQELNDLYTRLQQSYQDNQASLQKAQTEKMSVISEKILAVVKKIGEEGGYIYIVDTSSGVIPFVNSTLSTDITDQVKKELGIQ